MPFLLDYIDATARHAVCVDLKLKASAVEEPYGRSRRFELSSIFK
jgi:hypothetical protein